MSVGARGKIARVDFEAQRLAAALKVQVEAVTAEATARAAADASEQSYREAGDMFLDGRLNTAEAAVTDHENRIEVLEGS